MRKIQIAALAAATAIALAGCGAAPDKAAPSAGAKSEFKACMVSDEGGFDDKSFNESGMDGMKKAEKELGVKIASAESKNASDFKKNVDSLIQQKCNLIIGVGFMLNDAIRDAARANEGINFALVDARFTEGKGKDTKVVEVKNAKPLVFNTAEAGYLAGYAAAGMSKSGKVSAFGGMQIPSVSIFMDGYADGVAKYAQDSGKKVEMIGWNKAAQNGSFVGNFSDTNQGKNLTEQQMAQGSDVIMPVAGPVGQGTLAAVKGKEAMVVGVDSDWAKQYPDSSKQILTSVVKEISEAVFSVIKEAKSGSFSPQPYVGDLKNKGVNIAPFHDLDAKVPAELKTKIDQLRKDIIDGKIKIESTNNP